jgi:glycerol-3-phosphate dehydrogenase (NAD(P)+)
MSSAVNSQAAPITVIGAGAWGTALAIMLSRAGKSVNLIARTQTKANQLQSSRQNEEALPTLRFPESLAAHSLEQSSVWQDTVAQNQDTLILLAVPAQGTRQAVRTLYSLGVVSPRLVLTAKGLERDTQNLLTDVVGQEMPGADIAVLSGPSFAHDVAATLPTAVTLAAQTLAHARTLCDQLQGPSFRPYASDDLTGVQLGGALKNVLAIAAGVVEGKGLGESAKAALITRGFAELSRLAISQGAQPETLAGLSGLGDLVLTCSTAGSRNFRFGHQLGQGILLANIMADGQPLAEGAKTAAAALALGKANEIDMPITATVAAVVEGGMSVDDAIASLMARPLKRE